MVKQLLNSLSLSDLNKIMIIPFWFNAVFLYQMFYPFFESRGENIFSMLALSGIFMVVSFWVFDFVKSRSRDKSRIIYPNLPYDLFYHYKPKLAHAGGYVYLIKRLADGIYKIGKAGNLENRVTALRREYGPIAIIAIWEVPDCAMCEHVALNLTQQLSYQEEGRQELRAMDDTQCWLFIGDFTRYVAGLEAEMPGVENNEQLQMSELWN